MLLNEKAWKFNNTLKFRESNLEALEQNTIDLFFHSDEEQELEEGFGKKLLTLGAVAALGLSALFAGINTNGTKDWGRFLPTEVVKQGVEFVQETNPGKNWSFLAPEKEGDVGKLVVCLPASKSNQADFTVMQFCKENNIDLDKWDFDEVCKGFFDVENNQYVTIYNVTRAN